MPSRSTWITAIVFATVTALVLLYTVLANQGLGWILISGFFAALGVGNIVVVSRMAQGHAPEGDFRLMVEKPRPVPGGKLSAVVFLPKAAARQKSLRAELVCWRIDEKSQPVEAVWRATQNCAIRPNVRGAISRIAIDIPAVLHPTALPGVAAARLHYRWELQVAADVPGLDLDRSFQILVQPPRSAVAGPTPAATADTLAPDAAAPEHSALWVLVAANLVPLAGAIFWNWRVQDVVFMYWIENLVIGAFHILRILVATEDIMGPLARRGALPSNFNARAQLALAKLVLLAFFLLTYVAFSLVHGGFLAVIFFPVQDRAGGLWGVVGGVLREPGAALALLAISASHAYSFFRNYLGRREYRNADLVELMARPYKRIGVTHVFVAAGGFALSALKSPLVAMALFVAIKIWFDAAAHRQERGRLARPAG